MITAENAFRQCSNAMYEALRATPAYISYRADVHVSVPSMHREREVLRSVLVRTADDYAIIHDLPQGREQLGHAFPLPPTFDALSDFEITGYGGPHDSIEAHVVYSHPLFFELPTPGPGVDVIVVRLQGYRAHYIGDPAANPMHVELEPLPGLIKRRSDLAFKDVYIDSTTFLPTRVTLVGSDDRYFQIDYTRINGAWIVNHLIYSETYYPPIRIARVHAIVEAKFDSFSFTYTPPDRRLLPTPSPAP